MRDIKELNVRWLDFFYKGIDNMIVGFVGFEGFVCCLLYRKGIFFVFIYIFIKTGEFVLYLLVVVFRFLN